MKKILILGIVLVILIGASVLMLFFGPTGAKPQDAQPQSGSGESVLAQIAAQESLASSSNATTSSSSKPAPATKLQPLKSLGKYIEISNPSGFVNTNDQPIKLSDYIGKKVILVDFLTYSCINCQRTFPYLNAWYNAYKDDGFIIVGIHTPEFAFEKDKQNVEDAMQRFNIDYPIVLDNDYGTWNAYGNQYWPRKYIIDIHGNIVYDHIGEGGYDETEKVIQYLLKERAQTLGEKGMASMPLASNAIASDEIAAGSPETYFGSDRNEYLGNGQAGAPGTQTFTMPEKPQLNKLYLEGSWNILPEYAISGNDAGITYIYSAKDMYIVASSDDGATVEVLLDGKPIDAAVKGEDVDMAGNMTIKESRLYHIAHTEKPETHMLQLRVTKGALKAYTFTFG